MNGILPLRQTSPDPFYFQLIPLKLRKLSDDSDLPMEGVTLKFNISKGKQKFDENRQPIEPNFNTVNNECIMDIDSVKLNFFLPTFNPLRKKQFTLHMLQSVMEQDFQIGQYSINANQLIEAYKRQSKIKWEQKIFLSKNYELQFEIFIDRTKIGVEKSVRQSRTELSSQISAINHIENTQSKIQSAGKIIRIILEQEKQIQSIVKQEKDEQVQQSNLQKDHLQSEKKEKQLLKLTKNSSSKSIISQNILISDKSTQYPFRTRMPTNKQIALMCFFLLFGLILMLLLVHPNKKI